MCNDSTSTSAPSRPWFAQLWGHTRLSAPNWDIVRERVDAISARCSLAPGDKVLDLACGAGAETIEFAARGAEVVGLDLSPAMLRIARARARERGIHVAWRCRDVRTIGWRNAFDLVMMRDVVFGIFDPPTNRDVLRRMISALRPNGALFLEVYNKKPALALPNGLERCLHYVQEVDCFVGHVKGPGMAEAVEISCEVLTVEAWRDLLVENGLHQINFFPVIPGKNVDESLVIDIVASRQ